MAFGSRSRNGNPPALARYDGRYDLCNGLDGQWLGYFGDDLGPNNERGRQLRRPYFFKDSGSTAASSIVSSARPASSAITKASGIFGLPLLIASAKISRAASTASWRAAETSGPGMDGLTWQAYATDLEQNLTDLHARVHRGAYRATPSRRTYIPKAVWRAALELTKARPDVIAPARPYGPANGVLARAGARFRWRPPHLAFTLVRGCLFRFFESFRRC